LSAESRPAAPTLAELSRESAWNRLWYGEGSLARLAAFRVIMMLGALYGLLHYRVVLRQEVEALGVAYLHRKWTPIYVLDVLGVEPMGPATYQVLYWGLWAAILLAMFGVLTRLSCALVALGLSYWIGTAYSFGKPHHEYTVLVFALAALPFAPAGARWSLDACLRRGLGRGGGGPPPEKAPFARLPIRVAQFSLALAYGFAGLSKLVLAGPTWANGYTLQGIMLNYQAPWTEVMTENLWFCRLSSIFVLAVQSSFPVVLFVPRLRWFYLPAAVGFHMMTWQTMGTGPYMGLWITLAAFVPWDRVPEFLHQHVGRGAWPLRLFWTVATAAAAGLVGWIYWLRLATLAH